MNAAAPVSGDSHLPQFGFGNQQRTPPAPMPANNTSAITKALILNLKL
jgi:hypothetical protein